MAMKKVGGLRPISLKSKTGRHRIVVERKGKGCLATCPSLRLHQASAPWGGCASYRAAANTGIAFVTRALGQMQAW